MSRRVPRQSLDSGNGLFVTVALCRLCKHAKPFVQNDWSPHSSQPHQNTSAFRSRRSMGVSVCPASLQFRSRPWIAFPAQFAGTAAPQPHQKIVIHPENSDLPLRLTCSGPDRHQANNYLSHPAKKAHQNIWPSKFAPALSCPKSLISQVCRCHTHCSLPHQKKKKNQGLYWKAPTQQKPSCVKESRTPSSPTKR